MNLFAISNLVLTLRMIACRDGFVKDQNENLIEFPPTSYHSYDQSIPVGHLRPLGWQRSADGVVGEEKRMLAPVEFFTKYVARKRPVVFRNVLEGVPVLTLWNKTEHLLNNYGDIEIDVVVKKELLRRGSRRMKFSKFLKDFLYDDLYLANYVPSEMMRELALPGCLSCGFSDWLMESELWMSSGGTSSLLHSHADHDLHCLIAGRKDFIFVHPNHKKHFDYIDEGGYEGAGHSPLDMDMINMFKYRSIEDVPWTYAVLRRGDCIFVPAGHLHQVRSYGKSISSTNHFAPTPELDFAACPPQSDHQPLRTIPLNEADFLWTFKQGKLLLSESRLDRTSMLRSLVKVMRNSEMLTKQLFVHFYEQVIKESSGKNPTGEEAWTYLTDSAEVSALPRVAVKSLPAERLDKVAKIFNIPNIEFDSMKKDEL